MRSLPVLLLLSLLTLTAPAQVAEDDPVPRLPDAELVFDQALDAFNGADYGMAFRRFWLVVRSYPLNRKTSAAWLMAARSLYRNGEYARAAELLDQFEDELPTSRYLVDVRLLRGRVDAQQRLDQSGFPGPDLACENRQRGFGDKPILENSKCARMRLRPE